MTASFEASALASRDGDGGDDGCVDDEDGAENEGGADDDGSKERGGESGLVRVVIPDRGRIPIQRLWQPLSSISDSIPVSFPFHSMPFP